MKRLPRGVASALVVLAAWGLRGLARSWRVQVDGRDPMTLSDRPAAIAAFWHENVLVMAALFRDRDVAISVSRSRDGDLISAVLDRLGYPASARGSSSRGGAALLRELVRRVAGGTTAAVPVDGPRGPAHQVKAGVTALAAMTGVPISPVVIDARPALRFGSWDRTCLPLPFARVVVRFPEEVRVDRALDPDARQARLRQLEDRLSGC